MVDFRYHLVTIIAIFLALALGIVVGTTQLNGQVLDDLNGRISGLAGEKRSLESTVTSLRAVMTGDQEVAQQIGPAAVADTLTGQRVVLVSTPNAPSELRDQLVPLLQAAGATIGSQVFLRPDLIDPTKSGQVQAIVDAAAPAGLDLSGNAMEQASQELAAALVTPPADASPPATDQAAADGILDALRKGDLIDVQGEVQPRATLAVLLTGEAVESADGGGVRARVQALLSVAGSLDAAGHGAVVAGPLTALDDGGLIKALRDDGDLSNRVSSVAGVDLPTGRISAVYSLREQADGSGGQYGGPGSDGPLPALGG